MDNKTKLRDVAFPNPSPAGGLLTFVMFGLVWLIERGAEAWDKWRATSASTPR